MSREATEGRLGVGWEGGLRKRSESVTEQNTPDQIKQGLLVWDEDQAGIGRNRICVNLPTFQRPWLVPEGTQGTC